MKDALIAKLGTADAHVAVIGLGYVGLPLAVSFAQAGYRVTGVDLDPRKVDSVNRGESYIDDVSSDLLQSVSVAATTEVPVNVPYADDSVRGTFTNASVTVLTTGARLQATTDFSVIAECDAVSICVPTPLSKTGDPEMSHINAAVKQVARYLHPGMVIVLESTTYPGTTTEVVLPILQATECEAPRDSDFDEHDPSCQCVSFEVGKDFFLAFSPERVDPGRTDWTTRNTPKVIGGVTSSCREVAVAYYGRAIDNLVPVSSPAAAEMVKLYENTFRMVNIGLANELLLMCEKLGLDAWEIIDAAATKPFGFMRFSPGPGLGGHCIPIDPHYLSWKLRLLKYNARFIELASEINTGMPRYWVQQAQDRLNEAGKTLKDSCILILGVAYKRDVSDIRESPALDIIHLLEEKGADVLYHDPHVPTLAYDGIEMTRVTDLTSALQMADLVVVVTDHSAYDWASIRRQARLIIDTRRATNSLS